MSLGYQCYSSEPIDRASNTQNEIETYTQEVLNKENMACQGKKIVHSIH